MGLNFEQFASNNNQKNDIDDFDFNGVSKHEEGKEDDFNFNFGDDGASKKDLQPKKEGSNLINLFDDLGSAPAQTNQNNNQNDFFGNMPGQPQQQQ